MVHDYYIQQSQRHMCVTLRNSIYLRSIHGSQFILDMGDLICHISGYILHFSLGWE